MDILKSLLSSLDKDAIKKLNAYIERKNKRNDVRNLELLAAIQTNDINSLLKLYPDLKNNKSAYHGVRKRLTDITLRFIAEEILHLRFHKDSCKTYIELSQYLYQIPIPVLAQKMLRKAEKYALDTSNYSVLNEVYTTWLNYQKYHQHESVPILTQKLKANQYAIIQDNSLTMAYAHLSARIQQIQLQQQPVNLTVLITETMAYYNIDLERVLTLQSLVKILDIANEYAAIYQDYSLVESFIYKIELSLSAQHNIPTSQIPDFLQVLYYVANYYLRIRAFDVSLNYLAKMQNILSANPKSSVDFQIKHDMLLSLNHFFMGDVALAQSLLERTIAHHGSAIKAATIIPDVYACLALYTCMQCNKSSLQYLSHLTRTDLYYEQNLGMLWTIKKNLMEIIAYITFDYTDLAYSRITSFKRRYQLFLKQTGEERVLQYVKLLEQYLQQPENIHTKKYQDKVHEIFEGTLDKDIFKNCFYAWLVSQWSKNKPYTILLAMHPNH